MTGILLIKKYSSGSELNMFNEYNFINDNQFDSFFGLLENEVKELCSRQECLSYEELAQWYDGYRTSRGIELKEKKNDKEKKKHECMIQRYRG